jgi:hypothetical protein
LLGLIVLAVFSPVLCHHFIESWDDSTAILTNPDYNPPGWGKLVHYWVPPPKDTFFVPVTYTLWGLLAMVSRRSAPPGLPFNPAYFYAANWLAHTLTCVLVFVILRRLVRRRLPAFLGAALFAFHPMQVEAVANAWSVYTPLSALFGFIAAWQYLIFSDKRKSADPSEHRGAWWHYAFASLAFLLALLTKPTIVPLPIMIAALEIGLRGRRLREVALPLGIWLAVTPVFVWLNQMSSPTGNIFVPEPLFVTVVPLDAIAFYLGKLFVPLHLVMDYGRTPFSVVGHPRVLWTCLVTIGVFVVLWIGRRKVPWLLTAFVVFVAGLLPTLGFVPFTFQHFSTVADRYAYLAMLGPAVAAAYLLARFERPWVIAISVAAVATLAGLSEFQLRTWRDDWTIASYTLQMNHKSAAGIAMFRYLYTRQGHHEPPGRPFPASSRCSLDRAALLRDAELLQAAGYWDLAAGSYKLALEKGAFDVSIADRLGTAYERADEGDNAIYAYWQALQADPTDAQARRRLEDLMKIRGKPDGKL